MAGRIPGQGSNWIRRNKRIAIYNRDEWTCVYCEADLLDETPTLDHLHPCELGGTNHESNLVTCCGTCNSSKQHLPLRRWLDKLAECGHDREGIQRRIRRNTRRVLRK